MQNILKNVLLNILALCLCLVLVEGASAQEKLSVATFAGGCFWCMEKPFDEIKGVQKTVSGYIGGHQKNPTYKQVTSGRTGHYEAVQITYDAQQVSYEDLLKVFWKNIDPVDAKGQFCDKGSQYLSGIFFHDQKQKELAEKSEKNIAEKLSPKKVATKILPASKFYAAEDYHQNYYQKNPVRYNYYRYACKRDQRLKELNL